MARAAAATVAVMGVLSLGVELTVAHTDTGITLPWAWFAKLPLLESVLESRFAMGCIPAIAILLALGTDRAIAAGRVGQRSTTLLWLGWLAVSLLPLAPAPLEVAHRAPTPAFFADGTWRSYVSDGSVVTFRSPGPRMPRLCNGRSAEVRVPHRRRLLRRPRRPRGQGQVRPDDRPTALLLAKAQGTGVVPPVDDATRATALDDLRFWNADVVVLPPGKNQQALHTTLERLLASAAAGWTASGPGTCGI